MARNGPESICGQSVICIVGENLEKERKNRDVHGRQNESQCHICQSFCIRDIDTQCLMVVKDTYEESLDLDDSNVCFNDSQSASLNKASLYANIAGPCVDANLG